MRLEKRTWASVVLALFAAAVASVRAEEANSDKPAAASTEASSAPAVPPFLKRPIPIEGDFLDGWKQTIPIESPISSGESVTLWIEDGWLAARRNSASGAVDWQLYLCPIDDIEEPMISVRDGLLFFEVTYGDSHYFIRDSSYIFHCRRTPKLGGKLFQKSELVTDEAKGRGTASSGLTGQMFAGLVDGEWYHVVSGPKADRWNTFIRLNPDSNSKRGSGVRVGMGLTHWHHGDTWLIDDGEFVVANRTLEAVYLAEKEERAKREAKESPPNP